MKRAAILSIVMLAFFAAGANAARMFVIENAEIPLRDGPGKEFRIISGVPAGAEVEVTQEKNGWSRLVSPTEGWLASDRLTGQPPSAAKLIQAITEAEIAKAENQRLLAESGRTGQELGAATQGKEELLGRISDLERELAEWKKQNANVVKLKEEKESAEARAADAERLSSEHLAQMESIRNYRNVFAILAGGAVLAAGYIMGAFFSTRRRHSAGKIRF